MLHPFHDTFSFLKLKISPIVQSLSETDVPGRCSCLSCSPEPCLSLQEGENPALRTRTEVLVQVVIQPLSFEIYRSSLGTVTCEFIFMLGGSYLSEEFIVILEKNTEVTKGLGTRNL